MKKTTRLLAVLLLAFVMVFVLAGCPEEKVLPTARAPYTAGPVHTDPGFYTFNDTVSVLASNWNNHIYETNDDSYPIGFTTTGFLNFFFNDSYDGYRVGLGTLAKMPEDVTAEYAKEWKLVGEEGYAYKLTLREDLCWENGEKITAYDYVESLKELLDPKKANYRASDYIDGDLEFAGAYEYFWAGRSEKKSAHLDKTQTELYIDVNDYTTYFFGGTIESIATNKNYAEAFIIGEGEEAYNFFEKYDGKGEVAVTEEIINDLLIISKRFGDENPEAWYEYCYFYYTHEDFAWENVGIKQINDYEFVMILDKYLTGFYLNYNLTGSWLVHLDTYRELAKFDAETGLYTNTYNTSVATTMSYGPYKMTSYQASKAMTFERNETWFGYKVADYDNMYQTDRIYTREVSDPKTVKMMFFKGDVMAYGLQPEDFDEGYRDSERAYASKSDSAFFFTLNGVEEQLVARTTDKENFTIMLNENFRKAFSLCINKDDFAASVSPARSAAYGLIGTTYIVNPETGETYRETAAAKEVLCRYYGMTYGGPDDLYKTLDEAVAAITGYDGELAKQLFLKAYEEELEAGRITEQQTITILYAASVAESALFTRMVNYMNNNFDTILKGTVLEGRIRMKLSEPLGNNWSTELKAGTADTCLCGWTGARMNPFGLIDVYFNPDQAYDAAWRDAANEKLTLTINGEEITMTLREWSFALNGSTIERKDEKGNVISSWNFGDGKADVDTRVYILAELEYAALSGGSYVPTMQDSSMALLTYKVNYVTDREDPVMGRGGMDYMQYVYTDEEWAQFVDYYNGNLQYK